VAVKTGAASGIGLACEKLFADQGAKVAFVDCQADRLAEATQIVKKRGYG
jgi:NADP-dependent 3-hydroxy acid dehydrogenase YdfG